jgi:hypothetical protein
MRSDRNNRLLSASGFTPYNEESKINTSPGRWISVISGVYKNSVHQDMSKAVQFPHPLLFLHDAMDSISWPHSSDLSCPCISQLAYLPKFEGCVMFSYVSLQLTPHQLDRVLITVIRRQRFEELGPLSCQECLQYTITGVHSITICLSSWI